MRRPELQPIPRQRLHETIAERLEEMILNGVFRPGEPLPTELEMAGQMAVSRAVVRDAIRVLAAKGLVQIRHGVGTFVTQSGRERLAEAMELSLRRGDYSPWEIYIIRRGLELIVVEEAIERATPQQIAQMRQALFNYRRLLESDPEKATAEHIRFHQLMVQSTGNRVLMDLLDPITVFRIPYHLGMRGITITEQDQQEYLRGHEQIVDAIEQRDLPAARAAMLRHLKEVESRARRATQEMEHILEPEGNSVHLHLRPST